MLVLTLGFVPTRAIAQCQEAELVSPAPKADAHFGSAVAAVGDWLVIGAPSDSFGGLVRVYRWRDWQWEPEATLIGSDTEIGDSFGAAVAIDAVGRIVIGAPGHINASGGDGAAYVFAWDGSAWHETERLARETPGIGRFGSAVALDGPTLVIGEPRDDLDAGAIHIFNDVTGRVDRFTPPDHPGAARFGASVSLRKGVLIVGAPGRARAYVFRRHGDAWSYEARLQDGNGGEFGAAVALQDDLALVGFPFDGAHGRVVPFVWNGTQWEKGTPWRPVDPQDVSEFGRSIALRGDTALVGAPGSFLGAGAAFVMRRDGTEWHEGYRFRVDHGDVHQEVGQSVALADQIGVIGVPRHSHGALRSGAAFVIVVARDRPSSWSNYGEGWPGTGGVPLLSLDAAPVIGTTVDLVADNSAGQSTIGLLLLGSEATQRETPLGGELLVVPQVIVPMFLPTAGLRAAMTIPCRREYVGLLVYAQLLEEDFGASAGVSFSPGLQIAFGNE
jgi:hypothetical protein